MSDTSLARRAMVDSQLRPEAVTDRGVLAAMGSVERERFVPDRYKSLAYFDRPLPIGAGRTMMPPAALGRLLSELAPVAGERALVVGSGSGYSAALLGAQYHESHVDDLEVVYSVPLLRAITAVMRVVQPTIVLTHSPQDYMEDHTNVSRLAVTAAFARGIPNFVSRPRREAWGGACTVYHAMPHGLIDQLRRRVTAGCGSLR